MKRLVMANSTITLASLHTKENTCNKQVWASR
jgi:hypothetical protein